MKFARKNNDTYVKAYTKKKAIEELKNEILIDKIVCRGKKITITTIPIKPKGRIFKSPVGTYNIILTDLFRSIKVDIKRVEGSIDCYDMSDRHRPWVHNHIYTGWSSPICWGNIYSELCTMRMKTDWNWLVKKILDFIIDWRYDDSFHRDNWTKRMERFQKTYKEYHNGN